MIPKNKLIQMHLIALVVGFLLIIVMKKFSLTAVWALFADVKGIVWFVGFMLLFQYLIVDFLKQRYYTQIVRYYVTKYDLTVSQLSKMTDLDAPFFSFGVKDQLIIGGRKQKEVAALLQRKYGK
ncbi:hypothetical protein [Enterococcus nangangensis]|uniref:hypothetical protein n=1 Tax=Enterococcus nangangensis TaxID=2559926 RepID=UPI0010F4654B|nr:hypothetical protein [Enterococcus nangangensis]